MSIAFCKYGKGKKDQSTLSLDHASLLNGLSHVQAFVNLQLIWGNFIFLLSLSHAYCFVG